MPLPVNISKVTVSGTYLQLDGTAAVGSVTFATKQGVVDGTGNVLLPRGGIVKQLDAGGAFTVDLPATDDSDLLPTDFTYLVTEQLTTPQSTRSYEIQLPAAAPAVNLADLAEVAPVGAVAPYLRTTGGTLTGDLSIGPAGSGLNIKEGANARMGQATLAAGAATVATNQVGATSRIFLSVQELGTVAAPKAVAVTARVAGTSFTITSEDATDTSKVAWLILDPAA
ncbi:hypothetical protein [Actinomadura sp. 3N508]|uniref:hypothetical protein n=1 Tax=Actinomadura sp. 3N508 TaxID=3375153 RepID=UPI0037BE0E24